MQTFFWVAVLAIGAYFLFFRKRDEPLKLTPIEWEEPEPSGEPMTFDEPTPEEAEVAKARRIAEEGRAARELAGSQHRHSLNDANQKIAKADEFVRDNELDTAVPWLFDEMQHWPSWLDGTSDWELPVEVSQVEGGGTYKDRWVAWVLNERKFKMHSKERNYYGGFDDTTAYCDYGVEADGNPVLAITCSKDITQEWARWRYVSAEALKVGPWISELVEFYHLVKLAHDRRMQQYEADDIMQRANNIDFGEPDED